ncbi:MAG: serine acetyltransferase [Pseudomonadota bacterium]
MTEIAEPVPSAPSDHEVSATIPDWSREVPRRWWDPSRKFIRSIRRWQSWSASSRPWAPLMRRWWGLQHRFWSVITGADIPANTRIGGGLILPHPNGVVINPGAEIGPNCLIFQQVTIGVSRSRTGVARIGGHVDIGAGARIIGPVTIGDHALIGANAVVAQDTLPYAVLAAPAAQVLPPRGEAHAAQAFLNGLDVPR